MVSRTRVLNTVSARVYDYDKGAIAEKVYTITASKNINTLDKVVKEIKRLYKEDIPEKAITAIGTQYTLFEMDDETFYQNAKKTKAVTVNGFGFTEVPADFRAKESK